MKKELLKTSALATGVAIASGINGCSRGNAAKPSNSWCCNNR